jgi:hypothetical protein
MTEAGETTAPDFKGAEELLRVAKEAHERGDEKESVAARYLVAVALNLTELSGLRLHTGHLRL